MPPDDNSRALNQCLALQANPSEAMDIRAWVDNLVGSEALPKTDLEADLNGFPLSFFFACSPVAFSSPSSSCTA